MSKAPTAQNGKGSTPRPIQNRKQFEQNWDKIFNNKPIESDDKK